MIVIWANGIHTLARVDDGQQVRLIPVDPALALWAAILAKVEAGELTIADFPATSSQDQ